MSRALEEVLFHCGEKGKKVCCPPVNKSKGFNRRETANKEFGDNCTVIDESNQGRYPEPSGEIPVRNFSDYKAPEISSENEYFLVPQSSHVNVNDNTKNQQKLSKHGIRRPTNPLKAVEPSTRPPLDITLRPPFGGSIKPLANYQMASIHARPQIKSTKNSLTSHRNFRLLPSEANCGVSTFANRITEGEEVSLGEYPWMVLTGLTGTCLH